MYVLGDRSGAAVELVNILSDDCHRASLFTQSLLTLCDGQVGRVGVFCEHDLASVMVKLPNTRGIPGEGLWGGKFLKDESVRNYNEYWDKHSADLKVSQDIFSIKLFFAVELGLNKLQNCSQKKSTDCTGLCTTELQKRNEELGICSFFFE